MLQKMYENFKEKNFHCLAIAKVFSISLFRIRGWVACTIDTSDYVTGIRNIVTSFMADNPCRLRQRQNVWKIFLRIS